MKVVVSNETTQTVADGAELVLDRGTFKFKEKKNALVLWDREGTGYTGTSLMLQRVNLHCFQLVLARENAQMG